MRYYILIASFVIIALVYEQGISNFSKDKPLESTFTGETVVEDSKRKNDCKPSREEFYDQSGRQIENRSEEIKKRRKKNAWWPFKERYIICENPTCCWGYRTRLRVSKCPECGHSNVAEDDE